MNFVSPILPKVLNILIILMLISILGSCMSKRRALNQWIGANQNELIEKWGEPDKIEKEGYSSVWIYNRFNGRFPGMAGSKSLDTGDGEYSEYDDAKTVKFIIGPNRTVSSYELE